MENRKQNLLDCLKLNLLVDNGVSSWDWYDASLEGFDERPTGVSAEDVELQMLQLLENGGVDNWNGYDDAMEELAGYADYVEETPFDDIVDYHVWLTTIFSEEQDNTVVDDDVVEVEIAPIYPSQVRLTEMIRETGVVSDDKVDEVIKAVWKRNAFPKLMDRALEDAAEIRNTKDSSGMFMEDARNFYLDSIEAKKVLKKYVVKNFGSLEKRFIK